MKKVLAIYRAERFSPNSVNKDKAIMDAVCTQIDGEDCILSSIKEDKLTTEITADIILTMGREVSTLHLLENQEIRGTAVINSSEGIRACARANIDRLMRSVGIPVAPMVGNNGYWIKRGDEAAQSKEDVLFAADENEKERVLERFRQRGIKETVTTAHVIGDLVKFYGVKGTGFFRTFYPNDDGETKFDDEQINGTAHHYKFSMTNLQRDVEKTAALTGIGIYGGDCIVRADGSYAIIDFNDWPSFSRCREEAARAIAQVVRKVMDKGVKRTLPTIQT